MNINTTKNGIILEQINVNDVHYEYNNGVGIKSVVISKPEMINDSGNIIWKWRAQNLSNKKHFIDYIINLNNRKEEPNIFDYEKYNNAKYI